MQHLTPAPLRVGYVPGVMPGKWERIWADRRAALGNRRLLLVQTEVADQQAHLLDGSLDMCLARGEAGVEFGKDTFHMIALYREQPVVVVGTEHPVAAYDEIDVVPMSLARLHHRKDARWVPLHGTPDYPVGLAWLKEPPAGLDADDREAREGGIQAFIGVVRGRTANSSR